MAIDPQLMAAGPGGMPGGMPGAAPPDTAMLAAAGGPPRKKRARHTRGRKGKHPRGTKLGAKRRRRSRRK